MDNRERDLITTELPTLNKEKFKNDPNQFELLKVLYGEMNSNYRNLADIRFKLLGFLPAISVLAWTELYKNISVNSFTEALVGIIVTVLGFRITYGIWVYDNRNDELYNDLVSRGRKIEEEFGVNTGLYKGRLKPNKIDMFGNIINHGRSLSIIYSSVFIGWGFMIFWYLFYLVKLIILYFQY